MTTYRSLTEETVHTLDNAVIQTFASLELLDSIASRSKEIPAELLDLQQRITRAHWSLHKLRDKHYEELPEDEGKAYYGKGGRFCWECNKYHEDEKDPPDYGYGYRS